MAHFVTAFGLARQRDRSQLRQEQPGSWGGPNTRPNSQGCCLAFVENENQILQMIGPLVVFKEVKRKKYRRGYRFAQESGRTRTNRRARLGSAWRPSITAGDVIATRLSGNAKRTRRLTSSRRDRKTPAYERRAGRRLILCLLHAEAAQRPC